MVRKVSFLVFIVCPPRLLYATCLFYFLRKNSFYRLLFTALFAIEGHLFKSEQRRLSK